MGAFYGYFARVQEAMKSSCYLQLAFYLSNLFFNRFFSVYYTKESLQDTKQLELTAQDHSLYRGISCEARQTSKVGTIAWFRMMTIPNHATVSMHDTGSWVKCQVQYCRGAT